MRDRAVAYRVLDEALTAHVALVHDGQPYALPVAFARDKDRVLLHGSTGSRLFRSLGAGVPACVTVTVLDGLVLARSLFESSMNYRSVMALGQAFGVEGEEKIAALQCLSEHLLPGRWAEARRPSSKELAATCVVAIPLDECSVKVSAGGPDDPEEDLDWPVWAGVVPLEHRWGAPEPAHDLRQAHPLPVFRSAWAAGDI